MSSPPEEPAQMDALKVPTSASEVSQPLGQQAPLGAHQDWVAPTALSSATEDEPVRDLEALHRWLTVKPRASHITNPTGIGINATERIGPTAEGLSRCHCLHDLLFSTFKKIKRI